MRDTRINHIVNNTIRKIDEEMDKVIAEEFTGLIKQFVDDDCKIDVRYYQSVFATVYAGWEGYEYPYVTITITNDKHTVSFCLFIDRDSDACVFDVRIDSQKYKRWCEFDTVTSHVNEWLHA